MICDISSEAAASGQPQIIQRASRAAVLRQRGESLLRELEPVLDGLSAKFANGDPNLRDDLAQEGAMAVLTAARRFQPGKGILVHYAARYAKGAMLHHRRWLRKFSREISLSDFRFEGDAEEFSPQARFDFVLCDDSAERRVFADVDGNLLRELVASILTIKERNVILVVFFDGYSPGEAATELGISAPRVTQLMRSALGKLRKHLTRTNYVLN